MEKLTFRHSLDFINKETLKYGFKLVDYRKKDLGFDYKIYQITKEHRRGVPLDQNYKTKTEAIKSIVSMCLMKD